MPDHLADHPFSVLGVAAPMGEDFWICERDRKRWAVEEKLEVTEDSRGILDYSWERWKRPRGA